VNEGHFVRTLWTQERGEHVRLVLASLVARWAAPPPDAAPKAPRTPGREAVAVLRKSLRLAARAGLWPVRIDDVSLSGLLVGRRSAWTRPDLLTSGNRDS